jgi:hypothetical protein
MAVAVTYNGTTLLTVTGGTSSVPARLSDFVTADRADTFELLGATAGADDLTLSNQIRPAELRALIIDFVVAAKTAEADYIHITGTDAWDGVLTETIDVSAGNGTYQTTEHFRTITDIDCNDSAINVGGTIWADGTVQVIQNQWGLIWDFGNGTYHIAEDLEVGNDSDSTYFTVTGGEHLKFISSARMSITAQATFQLGTLTNGQPSSGAALELTTGGTGFRFIDGGVFKMYGSFMKWSNTHLHMKGVGTEEIHIYSSVLHGSSKNNYIYVQTGIAAAHFSRVYFNDGYLYLRLNPDTFQNVHINDTLRGVFSWGSNSVAYDVLITNFTNDAYAGGTSSIQFVSPRAAIAAPKIENTATNNIRERYYLDLMVRDKLGTPLQNVSVDCERAHIVVGTDSNDYKCIVAHTSGSDDDQPITGANWATYWEATGQTGRGATWYTAKNYVDAESVFSSILTDVKGDMAQQILTYRRWVGTAEQLEVWFYKLILTLAGYPSKTIGHIVPLSDVKMTADLLPLQRPQIRRHEI